MDFTQTTVSGIQPPTTPKTNSSNVGVAVSSTSTYFGKPLVIKALSDAAMYKTQPVSFFSNWNDGTTSTLVSLGQNTFKDPTTAALFVTSIQTGTHEVFVTWPGENKFAPFTTADKPVTIEVAAGKHLDGTFTLTASTASGTLIQEEGGVTFTAEIISSLGVPGTILFVENHEQLAEVSIDTSVVGNLFSNKASFSLSTMTAGVHVIEAIWSGGYIQGEFYEGKVATIVYTVLSGRPQGPGTTIQVDQLNKIVGEGTVTASFEFYTNVEPAIGNVTFYANTLTEDGIVGTVPVINNSATITFTNTNVIGANRIGIYYDGNYPNHPRFTPYGPTLGTYSSWTNLANRETTLSLNVTPALSSRYFGLEHFVATLNTSSNIFGEVKFYQDTTYLGKSQILNNVATFLHREYNTGTYNVSAVYSGSTVAPKWAAATGTDTYTVVEIAPYEGNFTLTSDNYSPNILNTFTLSVSGDLGSEITGYMSYFEERTFVNTTTSTVTTSSITVINQIDIVSSGSDWVYNNGAYYSQPWAQVTDVSGFSVNQIVKVFLNYIPVNNSQGRTIAGSYMIKTVDYNTKIIRFNPHPTIYGPGALFDNLIQVGFYHPQGYVNGVPCYSYACEQGYYNPYKYTDVIALMDPFLTNPQVEPLYVLSPQPFYKNLSSGFAPIPLAVPQIVTVYNTSTTSTVTSVVVTATLGTSFFNSTTQTSLVVDPANFIKPQTGSHKIFARWSGGYVDNAYADGIDSNTVTVTTSVPTLALSMHAASAGATDNANDTTFFLPARLQTVVSASNPTPGTVTFYKDGTYIGSTATTGQTNSFIIPEGTIVPGSHGFTATWTATNINPIASNGITKTISGKVNLYMSAAMDSLASSFYYYNYDRTANTSTTATFSLASMVIDNAPTGTFTLYNGSSTVATYTANWTGYTSGGLSGNLHWNPQTAGLLDQGNKTLSLVYSGDNHYNTTSTTFTFAGITKVPAITPTLTVNTTNTFANPVTFTVQTGAARPVNPVQLRDGSTAIASGYADSTGTIVFSGITLTSGTHVINVIVPGDDVLANTATTSLSVVKEDPTPNLPVYANSFDGESYMPGNPSPNINAFTFLLDPLHRIDSASIPNKYITVNIYYRDYNNWFTTKGPLFKTVVKTVGDFSNPAGLEEYYYNGNYWNKRTITNKYVIDLRNYPEFNADPGPGNPYYQGPVIINGVGHNIHGFWYEIIYTGGGIVPAFTASGFAGPLGGNSSGPPKRAIPANQTDYYVISQGSKKY